MPWIAIGPFPAGSAPKSPARPPIYHSRNISIEMLIRYRSLRRMQLVIDFCETYLRLIDATEPEMQQDLADRHPHEREIMIRILKALQSTRAESSSPAASESSESHPTTSSKSQQIRSTKIRNRILRNQEVTNRKPRTTKPSGESLFPPET